MASLHHHIGVLLTFSLLSGCGGDRARSGAGSDTTGAGAATRDSSTAPTTAATADTAKPPSPPCRHARRERRQAHGNSAGERKKARCSQDPRHTRYGAGREQRGEADRGR